MRNSSMTNRLINEKSPYLLQHAKNPIDWYPWGEEAFLKAKTENKPIFLSIGYSTCHWCHVMAHESFEDKEIAKYLNANFISIKVDREERPDVDATYMTVCQTLTGSGGWPLTAFITNDKKPFWAGTYFPPDVFLDILNQVNTFYHTNQEILHKQTDRILEAIKPKKLEKNQIDYSLTNEAFHSLKNNFDSANGGFSAAPKFPTPHNILFLFDYYLLEKNDEALTMVEKTLTSMRKGGIYDHVGYGFHRYSTDQHWLVPHFEKMLYDNALLLIVYLKAYKITKNDFYKSTALEIITFLQTELKAGNVYHAAIDADTSDGEGYYYTFTLEEIRNVLKEDAELFIKHYKITEKGNFEGRNILNTLKQENAQDKAVLACLNTLYQYRSKRNKPIVDNKIMTGYHGLLIKAYSMAYEILKDKSYLEEAKAIYKFIEDNMIKENKLYTCFIDGSVKTLAYCEDYAYLIYGLIELHQVTQTKKYLNDAVRLNKTLMNDFYDFEHDGFFLSGKTHETMILNPKEIYDGATPSANAVAINNLLRLSYLNQDYGLYEKANKSISAFMKDYSNYPSAYVFHMINILYLKYSSLDITFVSEDKNDFNPYKECLNAANLPLINIIHIKENKDYKMINKKATAYICKGKNCLKPIKNLIDFKNTIENI